MRKQQRAVGAVMVIAIAAFAAGCSGVPQFGASGTGEPPAYVNITRTDELQVRLLPQGSSAVANEHPAAFKPAQLEALLASLRVRTDDGGESTLASPSRLGQLAADMSKGFVRAGPRQDVAFAVFRRTGGSILSTSRRVTSGRAFYRDKTLNLIFGEFDADFSEFRDLSVSPLKNGSRTDTRNVSTATLVAAPSWHAHGSQADWIELPATPEAIESAASSTPQVIESSSASGAQPLRYGPAAAAAGGGSVVSGADASTAERVVPSPSPGAASTRTPGATRKGAAAAAPSRQTRPAAERGGWSRIEDRLSQLKRLRDKNLISAQDYQNKKDALLRELP